MLPAIGRRGVEMGSEMTMPFCDLLCHEEAGVFAGASPERRRSSGSGEFTPENSGESMTEFIVCEFEHSPASADYPSKFRLEERREAVAWIRKVQDYYRMQPLTAYLAVNYMDRFLSTHSLPQANGWPLQLLSVTCLSLAAKMEETHVPSLIDLQVEGTRFTFEPKTVFRMELLVLSALEWKLRAVTPFTFINFFANKVDPGGTCVLYLTSRAAEIILSSVTDNHFLKHCPSSMAAAAILHAASEEPNLAFPDPENAVSWCIGLSREDIIQCYNKLIQSVGVSSTPTRNNIGAPSSSSLLPRKRRKLLNYIWVDDEDDEGEETKIQHNDHQYHQ